jgi:small subunit ribosomal protein S16
MLKIRLQRVGRKHNPCFRIVLSDSRRAAQSGSFLEILGNYDPRKHAENFQVNSARIAEWISRGAQLSGTVHNLFVDAKLVSGPKRDVSPKAKKKAEVKATSKAAPETTPEKENAPAV